MRFLVVVFVVLTVGCGGAQQPEPVTRELPDPIFTSKLPDPPPEVAASERIVLPVSECTVEGSNPPEKAGPGVMMSMAMAQRSARLRVAYDEIRGLYEVDLRTMDRERAIYQKQLEMADREIDVWRQKSRRSWWEENRGWVGLGVGLIIGVGLTIGVAAALDGVTDSVE